MASKKFDDVYHEFERRVRKLQVLCDVKFVKLVQHFCAVLLACDNEHNQHFAENALTLFTFIAFEIETLTYGYLPLVGQERHFKGFISKRSGSFDPEIIKSSKRDMTVRLTVCCVEYLNNEADSNSDRLNQIDALSHELDSYKLKVQRLGEDIASALTRKNRGRGGFKFIFNVKYYGGFKYSSECSADTDARGRKIPRVSDGETLLKLAVDHDGRDLFNEIESLLILPKSGFSHEPIVAAEERRAAIEYEEEQARRLAHQRKCAENEIIAQKRSDEKKRLKMAAQKANEIAAAEAYQQAKAESFGSATTKVSVVKKVSKGSEVKKKFSKTTASSRGRTESSQSENSDFETAGGFALADYRGDLNDTNSMRTSGLRPPVVTGNLDVTRDVGYEDLDHNIVKNLRGASKAAKARVDELRNYVLRAGQAPLSNLDTAWSDSENQQRQSSSSVGRKKSQLTGLTFDECEGPDKSRSLLVTNSIDLASSSDDSSVRAARSSRVVKAKRPRKPPKTKAHIKHRDGDFSGSSCDEAAILRSSSSDSESLKRKPKVRKTVGVGPEEGQPAGEEDDPAKPRKTRDAIGLSEHQVVQYDNLNVVPFQFTADQLQTARLFEVDGRMMSDDDIKNLIFEDRDVISKNLDTKFVSFVRQHIMVDVFKDVHFITNVIEFYRMKRALHETQDGEHIVCVWQTVLKDVASDLINELVASNKKILEQMDNNLLDLKEFRKQKRLEASLSGSIAETERIEADLADLKLYKKQMKLNKKALEEIEKVMKRRVISFSHSFGAKIGCVWAKLNGFQHLLRNNMSRFEKKFLLDPSMPFFSVLSDDLSRRWGNVVTSPGALFQGIDLADSNDTSIVAAAVTSVPLADDGSDRDVEMDVSNDQSIIVRGSDNPSSTSEVETDRQDPIEMELVVQHGAGVEPFASPIVSSSSASSANDLQMSSGRDEGPPLRPWKAVYTSAMMTGSQSGGSPNSASDSPAARRADEKSVVAVIERHVANPRYQTPLVIVNRRAKAPALGNTRGDNVSYLSSAVSSGSSTSGGSPNDICASNAAVLFDELKHMSQDTRSVESMKRFIEVMNEKPANVAMPVTKAEEDEILRKAKAKAKKKKEEEEKAEAAKKTAGATGSNSDIEFSSADEGDRVVRQKTDSYALFQKLFLFVCKKHVEVKDSILNLQFFGQRLVRSLSNSALLKFLLLVIRHRELSVAHLVVYFMDEKRVFAEFKCLFGVAYDANAYSNILGDGFCVLRAMFALLCNELSGYKMTVAAMQAADSALFRSSNSRRGFYSFLNDTRESIDVHCGDELTKTTDKKKLKTLMILFGAFPQLKQVPAAYWGCLDWVAYASFNCTAFSTNYPDSVPGYAQLHCSTAVRRDMSSANALMPYSLEDIHRILSEPATPNFCVLEGQHAFVVRSPAKENAIESFKSVLGLFLGACQLSVSALVEKSGVDFLVVEEILEKMISDNSYTLSAEEASLVGLVIKHTDESDDVGAGAAGDGTHSSNVVVLIGDDPVVSPEEFRESRNNEDVVVVDLCDSDTGDMDRVKARAARAQVARNQQELAELQLRFEVSERENRFLLRLLAKEPSLMHNPPLEISSATSPTSSSSQ